VLFVVFGVLVGHEVHDRSRTLGHTRFGVSHDVLLEVLAHAIALQALYLDAIFLYGLLLLDFTLVNDGLGLELEVQCINFDFVLPGVGLQHGS